MWEELQKLLALVASDKNAEAQALADKMKVKIDGLDESINSQERQKNEAIETRDKAKASMKALLGTLGVESADDAGKALTELKSSKAGDETVKDREIANMQLEIDGMKKTALDVGLKSASDMQDVLLEKDIATYGVDLDMVKGALGHVHNYVKGMSSVDGKNLVFKNEDGTTHRTNGKDSTTKEIMTAMRDAEKEAGHGMFFKISVQDGTPGPGAGEKGGDFVP